MTSSAHLSADPARLGRTAAARHGARRRLARRRHRRSARGVRQPRRHAAVSAAARRWYWRQAVPLAARFAAGRIVPALTPPRRRRLTVADIERTSSLGSGWSRELRHAWRALWQRPALTATIVCTLALALAANAVVFNLADALYLRPLRFADVDRLIVVASDAIGEKPYLDRESVTPADLRDWRQSITTATGLSAVEWWDPEPVGRRHPRAGGRLPGHARVLRDAGRAAHPRPHLRRRRGPARRRSRRGPLAHVLDPAVQRRSRRCSAAPSASTARPTKWSA